MMDNNEAIKRIQDHMRVHHIGLPPHIRIREALDIAIMALRKQTPEKQRIDNDDWRCCPRCNETFFLTNAFNKRNKYCGNCGQALDWRCDNA